MAVPVLNTELVLETPTRVADTGGGFDVVWTPVGTVWAQVRPAGASEAITGRREAARVTHKILIRSAPANSPRRPSANARFRSGQRVFAIHGVSEADQRGQYLTCWAEEGPFS